MNQYEVAVLYHPDLEIDLGKASKRVEKIFADNGGKIVNTDNWGKRKLAYSIKKNDYAIYVFYTLELPAGNVQKVESTLNIMDEVVRFLITRPDLKAMARAEAAKADKAKRAAEREAAGASDSKDSDASDEPVYNRER